MAKTYDTYKDSGIAWIGEIPSEWEVCRMKNISIISSGDIISKEEYMDNGQYPIIGSNGEIGRINKINNNKNVLTTGRVGSIGTVQLVKDSWITDNALIINITSDDNIRYIYYALPLLDYQLISTGTAQPLISASALKTQSLPLPSVKEQQSITSFLDSKCAEIDALISLQEEMISELQAYKQSVITEAVTKGLNPHAKMKDSGVEWIGEIPEEWAVCSTKHLFNLYSGATPKTDNDSFWDGNIPWITPADFKTEDVYISKGRRNITQNGVDSCGTTIVPANSVIFSKRAPIGLVVLNKEPLCTNQGCISCVPKETFSKYYYYAMSVFTDSYELYGAGTTFMEISATSFANFKLPNPSFEEQHSIATYLDEKTSQIDSLIALKQEKIQELKDYKKSIIYEYVTGKKKV